MSNFRPSWTYLPPELRNQVLSILPDICGDCALLATVSREWQSVVEPINFAEIHLTPTRLSDPKSEAILFRHRDQINYIWYRIKLKPYDCSGCKPEDPEAWGLDDADNRRISDAFQSLFAALSTWESGRNLTLDISVYSPSDTQHWFKYLTFHPDTRLGKCPSVRHRGDEQGTTINDLHHDWIGGRHTYFPSYYAIEHIFNEIMAEGPFPDEESEMEWWRTLPLVPAISAVLLRQQTRRRWKPVALANMLTRFPNLKELCYEPWREWDFIEIQTETDELNQTLIESLVGTKLSKLSIFENFNQWYPRTMSFCPPVRVPNPAVSRKLARSSLELATLSASFMVDASYFFEATNPSWRWESLTNLALTSRVLAHDLDIATTANINEMLRDAATAALRMPKLGMMEIWNGREGLAMVFRYQKGRDRQAATITVRGTFELALVPEVKKAWNAVAIQNDQDGVVYRCSSIDPSTIRSHGDAICQLGLSTEIIRPVSLQQILHEHELRA